MAKKQKKSKKQTKKSAVAGLVKAVAATAANAAQSTKTYKNTVKKSAAPSARSLAQQGVNAAASAAARQAAAAAAAKRKQEQKRAAARNATASSMQNTKNQQKKRSGLVLAQNRANGNKQKTGLVLPGLAGQKRDAKKEYEKFKEQHGTKAGNSKNRNKSGKKEKSGLVLAQRRTPGTLSQTGKNLYQAGKRQMNKSITDEKSVKKAINKGKEKNALGSKVEKHNETYDTKRGIANAILKMGNIASGAAMSATAEQTMGKSFTNPTGHHSTKNNKYWNSEEGQKRLDEFFASEAGKKAIADYQNEIKKSVKKANKQIDKNNPAKIKYSYEDLTFADYNKIATATQQGQLHILMKNDKELNKKVADLNVHNYVKGAGAMGALDQMTMGLSVSDDPVYKYSKAQKQIMEKQKETTGYNVGRMVGGAIEFGLGGTGTLGSGLAKTGGKLALTNAAKQGGKTLAKTAAKNVGKEVAADAVVSLPLNSLDALKASYKDGKFDKKTFAKELALNVGGDILIGGGVSGITHGLSARQARNFNRINKTLEKGGTVSTQEMKFYDKHLNELADEVDAMVKAQDGITKSTSASTAANATAKAKGGTSASAVTNAEVKEYARLKGKQNAGVKLTAEEQKSMNRIVAKAVNDNVEKFVDKAVEEVRAARASGEGAIANEAEKLEMEKARQEAVIGNSNNPAEIAVAKAKLNEVNAKLDRYKAEHGEKIKKYADADAQAQRLEVGSSGTLNARTPSAEGMTSSADNISDSAPAVKSREAETDITHKLTNEKVSAEYSNALKKLENGDPVTLEEYLSIPEIREAKNRVAAGSSSDIPDSIRGQHRYDVTKKMSEYGSAEVKIIDGKEKVEYTGSVNRDRRADIILGLPASGKSSAIVDPISQKYKSKLIDSDEAKKMLDGFDDGWGAGYVHRESTDIVDDVLSDAMDMGENVVIPKVGGDYIGIEKLREMLKENGYSVNIHLCELDPNKAAGRNLRRFATTGRFVDLEATSFKYQNKPTEVYEQLVKEGNIDGHTRTSNDVGYGELPIQREGTETIPYNWRNDRRGGGDDGRKGAKTSGGKQEEPAGLVERTPRNAGALDAPSFNAREAKLQKANNNVPFKDVAEEAYSNPGKQYDTAAERIKAEHPSPEKALEDAQRISPDEVPQARQTAVKMANQASDDVADIVEPWIREGLLNKKMRQTQEEAIRKAEKELADGRLYDNFLESKPDDEHLFMARAKVLLEDLMKKAPESNEASEMLLRAMDKATEAASHGGRLLNATKLLLRNTPQGRVRVISKEVERLNAKFAPRMKGKELKLSDEQVQRILKATDDTIEDVTNQINKEIWEDIPATWFEKLNEIRHMSMLFNAKTHGRNLIGNAVFWQARLVSDGIEIAVNKIPAVRKRIEKLGGTTQMVHVTRKELSDNKEALNKIFDENYQKSGSKSRYVESSRPDGIPIVKNKAGNWLIQTNYKLLEKEDLITFRPEYRKNFIRWCKANDVPFENISSLTKEQMQKADAYAIRQAEKATFRDNSAFSRKIVGWKEQTAGKKGKTFLGTAGYRAANVALESVLPFVKTPVNILKRSVDYSPLGLARSAVELASAKTADDFMQGVHHLATGLTGSGVFALGMWLANNDLITVQVGGVSGDAYYDRDMGYQDYSLLLSFNGKQYSMTIDWLSPMQTSLFMGAQAWCGLADDGLTLEDMFDGLTSIMGPMLDMSFMSSSKDTIEMFMERVYRNGTGDDADWSGAMFQTLFGSIPQGYLNSFVPQLLSQTAQAFDNKQRDTRSTLEDPVAASWDSWKRKMINKVPGLRNYLLNPKLDRNGDDKETGNNILMRFLNAYANPSNVKKINLTDRDREIIKIYNHLPEGTDEKKYYYYNFTGNPNYNLGNGKRMTYDEAYKYGKENRRQQTMMIDDMIKAPSYKNMTWQMKGDEAKGAHFIGQTFADRKTYGNNYARNQIIRNGSESDQKAATRSKKDSDSAKDFVDFYLKKEKLVNRSHDSSYETKALAVALSGNDKMARYYKIKTNKVDAAKQYLADGGSRKEYSNAMCNVVSVIKKAAVDSTLSNKAVAAASYNINERTYHAMGISSDMANMGVGLKNFGYTFDALEHMRMDSTYDFDADGNGSLKKSELMAYIDSLGLGSREEKACVFAYFSDAKNPYGSVPNYLGFSDTGSSSGRSSRKDYGRSSRKGSKASKATAEKPTKSNLPSWEDYVKDYITEVEGVSGVKFKDWDSPLDQAYRNKINSILNKMDA